MEDVGPTKERHLQKRASARIGRVIRASCQLLPPTSFSRRFAPTNFSPARCPSEVCGPGVNGVECLRLPWLNEGVPLECGVKESSLVGRTRVAVQFDHDRPRPVADWAPSKKDMISR